MLDLRERFGSGVYLALAELEDEGLVVAREEPGGLECGGRRRRFYRIRDS